MKVWKIESGSLNVKVKAPTIIAAIKKLRNFTGDLGVLLKFQTEGESAQYWDTIEAFKVTEEKP